jgi:ATP-dependent RNA helicase RhlE
MSNYRRVFNGRPKRTSNQRSFSQYRPQRRRTPRSFDPFYLIKQGKTESVQEKIVIENSFADFKVDPVLKKNIQTKGYLIPTPIQDKTIPPILKGLDVVGVANTGTGKTAAFLIPLIDKVLKNNKERVLIITPTRELAAQIESEFLSLSRGLNLFSALCIGGVSLNGQTKRLRQSPHFVIGTPGRLKDLEERRLLWLNAFSTIVLDEVDRMLDMGFIHDVQHLVSLLSEERQSLFFSATIEGKVQTVMSRFLKNPTIVSVKTGTVTDNVEQEIVRFSGKNKIDVLHDLLIQKGFDRVLVFGRTKWSMEKLSKTLIDRGFRATSIHGNKSQNQRQRALRQFKAGEVNILLATDVAQRGLDIDSVSHVINFDLPETQEDYIHRIGRTGRADKKGFAITLMA